MPRASARSPAVGPAHSHATPEAFRCPRAREAPTPKATPDAPPPRKTTPSRRAGERRMVRHGCAKGPKHKSAAQRGRRPSRKAPVGAV